VGPQQFELVREPFTLGAIAEDIADIMSMKADLNKVVVLLNVDAALRARSFVGDAFRLRQCLINLVRLAAVISGLAVERLCPMLLTHARLKCSSAFTSPPSALLSFQILCPRRYSARVAVRQRSEVLCARRNRCRVHP
jgi:hypothetical protein